jgi:ATP synthase protein I
VNADPRKTPDTPDSSFSQKVGARAERKMRARRHSRRQVWSGLGMIGIIGWTIVIPTLVGIGIGVWLDKSHPGSHSWTLTLMIIGLFLGCLLSWQWVARQYREIGKDQKDNDEKEKKDE